MSLYNMLFGMNAHTDLLLAVLGLRKNDVERLRDVFADDDGKEISIHTRTGGNNRADYPNLTMRKLSTWQGSQDDEFDNTYCTDTFLVPEAFVSDVCNLREPLKHGLRAEFAQHLALTLMREPTESDKAMSAYEAERAALQSTRHDMANGHTFVPHDDHAMSTALELAEANGGKLRSCWGILPLAIQIKTNFQPFPNALNPEYAKNLVRFEARYRFDWEIDTDYWTHCQERWSDRYPLAMSAIAESVNRRLERENA